MKTVSQVKTVKTTLLYGSTEVTEIRKTSEHTAGIALRSLAEMNKPPQPNACTTTQSIVQLKKPMGLFQLAVTWYLPTGTYKTKRLHQDKFEFSLFWVSQWAACPPACTM